MVCALTSAGIGQCTYTFDNVATGLIVTSFYDGSITHSTSSSSLSITVDPAPTSLTITPSATPSISQPVTPSSSSPVMTSSASLAGCGAPLPSQPTWVCRNSIWEAVGDQSISVVMTNLTSPMSITGNLNVTNPNAILTFVYSGQPVMNISGNRCHRFFLTPAPVTVSF